MWRKCALHRLVETPASLMTLFVDHLVTARSLEEKSAEDNKLWLNTVGFGAAIKPYTVYRLSSYLGVVSRTNNLLKHQTIISTMRICLMSSVCVLTLKENYALNCYISLPRKSLKHHINIPRTALVPQETEESIIY